MPPSLNSQRIEEIALNAWPALNTLLYDGWILRFANGYTKRANSVTPLFEGSLDLNEKIDFCSALYQQQDLRPIFRLATINDLSELDQQLARRNYELFDRTQVQTLDLNQVNVNFSPQVSILTGSSGLRSWLDAFHSLNLARSDDKTHEKMLGKIISPVAAVTMAVDAEIVACGLGVVEGQYMGLFDIVTAPKHRRKGFGTILTESLLAWGKQSGASTAYLQVMENNETALALYKRFGFKINYRYWYRAAQ